MPDDQLSAWLGEHERSDEPEGGPPTWWDSSWKDTSDNSPWRRRRLLLLAVVPWLAVVGLGIAGWRPGQQAQVSRSEQTPRATSEQSPAPLAASGSAGPAPLMAGAPLAPPDSTPGSRAWPDVGRQSDTLDPALGAAAALAVQNALTSTDHAIGRTRYIELALPETATWLGNVVVVRVAAAVLEGTGGRWERPRTARYAVPLRVDADTIRVLSVPWSLPDPPRAAPGGAAFAPIEDQALAAAVGRALGEAGYRDVDVRMVARDPSILGVLQAGVTATGPGEQEPRSHTVWLRDEPAPAVLGAEHLKTDAPPDVASIQHPSEGGAR